MTDERFEEVREFIQRRAVPPTPWLLPDGMGVPVVIVDGDGDGAVGIVDEPRAELRLSMDEYADLRRRLVALTPDPVYPPPELNIQPDDLDLRQ